MSLIGVFTTQKGGRQSPYTVFCFRNTISAYCQEDVLSLNDVVKMNYKDENINDEDVNTTDNNEDILNDYYYQDMTTSLQHSASTP